MKKTILVILMLIMVAVLAFPACTQNVEVEESNTAETTEVVEQTGDTVAEAANNYFAQKPDDSHMIAQDAFVEKIASGEELFVLDLRSAEDYATSHILYAINTPWGTEISDNLDKLPADETIYVYCYSGQTAGQAVALLSIAGFDAKSVKFGWKFGISKVEGVDEITETVANEFAEVKSLDIDTAISAAVKGHFEGLADVSDSTYKNYMISPENANKIIGDDSIVFLSIRKADDFAGGHIEGAINIPWGNEMQKDFDVLPMDKTIIVYCYSGQTAAQTVAAMRLMGYDAVSLNGGIGVEANDPIGWVNSGYELAK
jgi:rhodanese-related sulfurtransferase